MSKQGHGSLHREWAEARSASQLGMKGQDEVATGGRGHPEQIHEVGLVINPMAILLGVAGG